MLSFRGSFKVSPKEHGVRLLAFLRMHCPEGISAKALKRAIDARCCRINERVESFSTSFLKGGDLVVLELKEQTPPSVPTCLYEDEDLLICNKSAGIISENAVFNALFPSYQGKLELIHRLDKDTSGAIMLAKSKAMRERMVLLFKNKEVCKFYLAVVDGQLAEPRGKIENYLFKKHQYQGQTIWGASADRRGLYALTYWERVKEVEGGDGSLLLCQPVTGRTHQLRVHLSLIGHPILGDYQYAKQFKCLLKAPRQLLHAHRLLFTHPLQEKQIDLVAPPPLDSLEFFHL